VKIVTNSEIDSDKVVKAVMISKSGRFLIMRVLENKKYIGQWDLPGGHLIVGEDQISGLVREVYEETSLLLKNVSVNDLFMVSDVYYYKVDLPPGKIKLSSEHDKYRFIKLSEMDDYEISEKFQKAIKRAFEFKPRS